jgi:hypothetical protein
MTDTSRSRQRVRKAGAFDIRTFIALLMGIYGIALVLMGLFGTSDEQLAKADDFNINLWAGTGMVLTAVVLQAWATLRPVVVPVDPGDVEKRES